MTPTVWSCHWLTFANDDSNTPNTVENIGIEPAIPRARITRDKSTGKFVAAESMQIEVSNQSYGHVTPSSSVRLLTTTTETSNADSDILRQELQRVHAMLNTATTAEATRLACVELPANWFYEDSTLV